MQKVVKLSVSVLMGVMVSSLWAQAPSTLDLQNEFIRVVVNNGIEDRGRFAVETTGGDPANPLSQNQSLIFGRPVPWTSYTTIVVDGQQYVFGGVDKRIEKRAGKAVKFGETVLQSVLSDSIVTECRFGPISVVQRLTPIRNPYSKVKDMAMIQYDVVNRDFAPHQVGVRVMLDTKLGANDGAPFRIGQQAIESEQIFSGAQLQDYWQAFDSLVSPNVVAQGILSSSEDGVYPPSRVILANWGTLVDYPWEFPYQPGRSFVREGELEKDTALALVWDAITVPANQVRTVRTMYGLGGVSLAKGALTLGLTAPAEVYATSPKAFLVVGYIQNSGRFDSRGTKATFELPDGLDLVEGNMDSAVGLLPTGYTRQIPIKVKPNGRAVGSQVVKFKVTSDTLEDNAISRTIEVFGKPSVKATLQLGSPALITTNYYVDVKTEVQNVSPLPIESVKVALEFDSALGMPKFEVPKKTIFKLRPNEKQVVRWKLRVMKVGNRKSTVKAIITSSTIEPKLLTGVLTILEPSMSMFVKASDESVSSGSYFYVSPFAGFAPHFSQKNLSLRFDPEKVTFLRFSPDMWMVNQQDSIEIGKGIIRFRNLYNLEGAIQLRFGKCQFKALGAGWADFQLESDGVTMPIRVKITDK